MSDNEQSVGKDDVNKLLLDSLSKGVDSLDQHEYKDGEETTKIFGIEMDSAFANMLEVTYNSFIGGVTTHLTPNTYGTVLKYGEKLKFGEKHLSKASLNRLAAGTSFAVNTAIYALPSISTAYELWTKQRDAVDTKVRQLGSTLDELKGKHGFSAYNSVRIDDNEMIAYDRWRMAKVHHTTMVNHILPTLAKIAPNIWFHERDTFQAFKRGETLDVVKRESLFRKVAQEHGDTIAEMADEAANAKADNTTDRLALDEDDIVYAYLDAHQNDPVVKRLIKKTQDAEAKKASNNEGFNLGGFAGVFGSNAALTTIANKLTKSSARNLEKTFPTAYSALDMVLTLQTQLGNQPTPRTFQLPNKGRSLPLETYVAEIMMQHQRDMAGMNANYSEIRDALKENVISAAKPLAAALGMGDISALSLITYIGGGKIIRNKGRLIATRDEVEAMIEHSATKAVQHVSVDPKDFWSDAPYNVKEGKAAIAALEGEERQLAILLIPHDLRAQFGVSEKESKEVDALNAKVMEAQVAEAIVAVSELGEKTLARYGLANTEISALEAAAERIRAEGVEAVHGLKSSAAHPNGIERVLLAVAVGSEVQGERLHLGKLVEQGRSQLAANENHKDRAHERHMMHSANENHEHQGHTGRVVRARSQAHGAETHIE